jgi:hypothetical protein
VVVVVVMWLDLGSRFVVVREVRRVVRREERRGDEGGWRCR